MKPSPEFRHQLELYCMLHRPHLLHLLSEWMCNRDMAMMVIRGIWGPNSCSQCWKDCARRSSKYAHCVPFVHCFLVLVGLSCACHYDVLPRRAIQAHDVQTPLHLWSCHPYKIASLLSLMQVQDDQVVNCSGWNKPKAPIVAVQQKSRLHSLFWLPWCILGIFRGARLPTHK